MKISYDCFVENILEGYYLVFLQHEVCFSIAYVSGAFVFTNFGVFSGGAMGSVLNEMDSSARCPLLNVGNPT